MNFTFIYRYIMIILFRGSRGHRMIGAGLKQARVRKGWTLKRLADELSNNGLQIKSRKISEYERGTSFPSASFLVLAASVLDVPSTYLMHVPEVTVRWRAFRKRSGFGNAVRMGSSNLQLILQNSTLN